MGLFRTDLSEQEQQEFRQWARENYKPYHPILGIWHPLVQMECVNMNAEAGTDSNQEEDDKHLLIRYLMGGDELKG